MLSTLLQFDRRLINQYRIYLHTKIPISQWANNLKLIYSRMLSNINGELCFGHVYDEIVHQPRFALKYYWIKLLDSNIIDILGLRNNGVIYSGELPTDFKECTPKYLKSLNPDVPIYDPQIKRIYMKDYLSLDAWDYLDALLCLQEGIDFNQIQWVLNLKDLQYKEEIIEAASKYCYVGDIVDGN